MKYLLVGLRFCMISAGVGKTEASGLTDLFNSLRSHNNLSFSSLASLATNPAGEIHLGSPLDL